MGIRSICHLAKARISHPYIFKTLAREGLNNSSRCFPTIRLYRQHGLEGLEGVSSRVYEITESEHFPKGDRLIKSISAIPYLIFVAITAKLYFKYPEKPAVAMLMLGFCLLAVKTANYLFKDLWIDRLDYSWYQEVKEIKDDSEKLDREIENYLINQIMASGKNFDREKDLLN